MFLGPNFFDPKLTRPKLFQDECTRRLAHLPSFCELVSFLPLGRCDNSHLDFEDIWRSTYIWREKKYFDIGHLDSRHLDQVCTFLQFGLKRNACLSLCMSGLNKVVFPFDTKNCDVSTQSFEKHFIC